jgi:hypothetical protein
LNDSWRVWRVLTSRMNQNATQDEISLFFPGPHLKCRLSRLHAPLAHVS